MPPPPTAYQPGTVLTVGSHEVKIDRYVSEGGFAHVYTCHTNPPLPGNITACLKRVAVPDKVYLNLLRAEVEAMQRLKGFSNVVQYFDSHAERSKSGAGYEVFVLMEYCAGGALINFMNARLRDQLKEHEVLKIMFDVTLGLAHMHYLKPALIHRDLKIENVLLTGDGTYKLCDFGSVSPVLRPPKNPQEFHILEDDIQHHTTMQYRSPEMLDLYRGFPIDEKSDIWALGVFLYKLCFYTTPFEQGGNAAILSATYVIPQKPHYSDRLKNMIRVLLQPIPTARPNVYQILQELSDMRGVKCPIPDLYSQPKLPQTQTAPAKPSVPKPVSRTRSEGPEDTRSKSEPQSIRADDYKRSQSQSDLHADSKTPSIQLSRSLPLQQQTPTLVFSEPSGHLSPQALPVQPVSPVNGPQIQLRPRRSDQALSQPVVQQSQHSGSGTHDRSFDTKFPALNLEPKSPVPLAVGSPIAASPVISENGFDFTEAEVSTRYPTLDEIKAMDPFSGDAGNSHAADELLIDMDQSPQKPTRPPTVTLRPSALARNEGSLPIPSETGRASSSPERSSPEAFSNLDPSDALVQARAMRERAQAQIEAARTARTARQTPSSSSGAGAGTAAAGRRPKSYHDEVLASLGRDVPADAVPVDNIPSSEDKPYTRKLKQILTGLSERSSTVILENDRGHIDSNMDFLRSLDAEGINRPTSSTGHRHLLERSGSKKGHSGHTRRASSLTQGWFGGRSTSGGALGSGKDRHRDDQSDDSEPIIISKRSDDKAKPLPRVPRSPATSSEANDNNSLSSSPSTESFRPSNSIQQRVHAFLSEQERHAPGSRYASADDLPELVPTKSVPTSFSGYDRAQDQSKTKSSDDPKRPPSRPSSRPTVPSKSSKPSLTHRNSMGSISTSSTGGSRRVPPKPAHLSPRPKIQQHAG